MVLHYFKSIFIFSVLFSSDNNPLSRDNDNYFSIIDTDGQGGLEHFQGYAVSR